MMELKYFDALDVSQHQTWMMECSWCPKRNPCSLFRTKDDQTQLQEFFIVVSWIRLFRSCLAELHHCSRTADVWLSSMSFSYVVWSFSTTCDEYPNRERTLEVEEHLHLLEDGTQTVLLCPSPSAKLQHCFLSLRLLCSEAISKSLLTDNSLQWTDSHKINVLLNRSKYNLSHNLNSNFYKSNILCLHQITLNYIKLVFISNHLTQQLKIM